MPPTSNDVTGMMAKAIQTMLLAIGEVRAETRGNRQAMLQRTGDMMERFDQRIDDLTARFDDRIEGLATEVFHRFSRQDRRLDQAERMARRRPTGRTTWRQLTSAAAKLIGIGQALALIVALILGLLGVLSGGELKAIVLKQLGL